MQTLFQIVFPSLFSFKPFLPTSFIQIQPIFFISHPPVIIKFLFKSIHSPFTFILLHWIILPYIKLLLDKEEEEENLTYLGLFKLQYKLVIHLLIIFFKIIVFLTSFLLNPFLIVKCYYYSKFVNQYYFINSYEF